MLMIPSWAAVLILQKKANTILQQAFGKLQDSLFNLKWVLNAKQTNKQMHDII